MNEKVSPGYKMMNVIKLELKLTSMLCFDDEQELILCNTTKNFKTWHTKLDD